MHLHVLRCGNEYVSAPKPASLVNAVMAHDIVANDRSKGNLVKDAGIVVALNEIVLIDHVTAIDVTPQPGTDIVMNMIAAENDAVAVGDLDAASFPLEVEAARVI